MLNIFFNQKKTLHFDIWAWQLPSEPDRRQQPVFLDKLKLCSLYPGIIIHLYGKIKKAQTLSSLWKKTLVHKFLNLFLRYQGLNQFIIKSTFVVSIWFDIWHNFPYAFISISDFPIFGLLKVTSFDVWELCSRFQLDR